MSLPDPELEALIAQARSEAHAEVVVRLRKRFVDQLLARAEQALGVDRRPALGLVGVVPAQAALEGVTCGAVKALVTELDATELDDPEVLERRVRAHNDVLLEALAVNSVVPIRFGALFAHADDVAAWLERNEAALVEELERLRDAVEWAVTVAQTKQVEQELVVAGDYLERRLAAGEEAARRAQIMEEQAAPWHERLSAHAEAAARSPGRGSVLDSAYLVRRPQQQYFDAAVFQLRDELGDDFELRLTGPWPPFSFVTKSLQ
jgi:hypothetical protein